MVIIQAYFRFEKQRTQNTKVVFMTEGLLLRQVIIIYLFYDIQGAFRHSSWIMIEHRDVFWLFPLASQSITIMTIFKFALFR